MRMKSLFLTGIAALGLAMVSTVEAAPLGNFDFTLASTLNGTTVSNATITIANGTSMPIQADKDLMLLTTITPNSGVNVLRSNVDILGGPSGTQRTTAQPINYNIAMTSSNAITVQLFLSRTNFYGATGLAVDQFGVLDSTNIYATALTEISGNWVP